jgi:hypothetical protein
VLWTVKPPKAPKFSQFLPFSSLFLGGKKGAGGMIGGLSALEEKKGRAGVWFLNDLEPSNIMPDVLDG